MEQTILRYAWLSGFLVTRNKNIIQGIQSWMPQFTRAPFWKTARNVNSLVEKDLKRKTVQYKMTNLLVHSSSQLCSPLCQKFKTSLSNTMYKHRRNKKQPRRYEMYYPHLSDFNFARFQAVKFGFR